MNHKETVSRWLWKYVDYDWRYWSQCVDRARQYAIDRRGETFPVVGTAFNWFAKRINNNINSSGSFVSYQRGKKAPQGAIIFFAPNKWNWDCGHVAIVDQASESYVTVIEQNTDWKAKENSSTKKAINSAGGSIRSRNIPEYEWVIGRYIDGETTWKVNRTLDTMEGIKNHLQIMSIQQASDAMITILKKYFK